MLRAAEAAERLGLSPRTIYALAAAGELPCEGLCKALGSRAPE